MKRSIACGFCALALAAHGLLSAGQRPVAGVPRSTWNAKAAKPVKQQIQLVFFATFARFAFDVVFRWY